MKLKTQILHCTVALFFSATFAKAATIGYIGSASTAAEELLAVDEGIETSSIADKLTVSVSATGEDAEKNRVAALIEATPGAQKQSVLLTAKSAPPEPNTRAYTSARLNEWHSFYAQTAGRVDFLYELEAIHRITTDLAPTRNFFGYSFGATIEHGTESQFLSFSSFLSTDPAFDLPSASNNFALGYGFDVEPGDQITVSLRLGGNLGREVPISAFFDGELSLATEWSLDSTSVLLPEFDDTITPVPVPIPATMPLMAIALGGFVAIRRLR